MLAVPAAAKVSRYSRSTCSLAQGVLRRNVRLDFTDGSCLKQLILTCAARPAQPQCCSRRITMPFSVTPCKGLLGCRCAIFESLSPVLSSAENGGGRITDKKDSMVLVAPGVADTAQNVVNCSVVSSRWSVKASPMSMHPAPRRIQWILNLVSLVSRISKLFGS